MKNNIIITIIISSIIGVFSGFIFFNYYENKNINYLEQKIISISEKSSSSIVSIIEKEDLNVFRKNKWGIYDNKVGGGSGFFINKEGIIITNNHVIKNKSSKYIVILNNGKEFNAEIIYSNKDKDIALLKINYKNKNHLTFIKDNNIKIGQFVITIGNTINDFNNSVSFGIISGLNKKIENNYIKLGNLIQTDANINPGNSGGPLINLEGKVVGINTLIIDGYKNISFAIKANNNQIEKILNKIKNK